MSIPENPLTKITRTKVIEGKSIPAFIHNDSYFYVDLDIYEDGVIWCWESTNLNSFQERLESGWVKTFIPNGKSISIHALGEWKIDKGDWLFDKDRFYEYVNGIIKEMNPQGRNLHQVFEKKVNKVIYAEYAEGRVYRENRLFENKAFPSKVKGASFHLFYKVENEYFIVRLCVFADKRIEINDLPQKLELDLNEVKELAEKGILLTEIPKNAQVKILGLGSFVAIKSNWTVSVENKLLEIPDMIESLNNRPTSIEICCNVYEEYLENPNVQLKEKLKIAYENIPEHQRKYVGDMDTKDTEVRLIIYGKKDFKNLLIYGASKIFGGELPPEPKDK